MLKLICLLFTGGEYLIEKRPQEMKKQLRKQFEKNRHVTDLRVIDMLIIKVIQLYIM